MCVDTDLMFCKDTLFFFVDTIINKRVRFNSTFKHYYL